MTIRVEFFGIARQRAGVSELRIDMQRTSAALSEVLKEVAAIVPQFAELLVDGRLRQSLSANLDGDRFVHDPATLIHDGQSLLILSADAGG